MKNLMIRLVTALVLLIIVVGTSFAQQIPASLPIGNAFPPSGVYNVSVGIVNYDHYNPTWSVAFNTQFIYKRTDGDLKASVDRELKKLADAFYPFPGTEGDSYAPYFNITQTLAGKSGIPVAQDNTVLLPNYASFKPVQGQDGQWHLPATVTNIGIVYQNYIPIRTPGLKWFEANTHASAISMEGADGVMYTVEPNFSYANTNGVFPGCSLAEGGGNYLGPDVLEMDSQIVLRDPGYAAPLSHPDTNLFGSVTLYFSDDRKVFGTYDVVTGNRIASSDDIPTISITPIASAVGSSLAKATTSVQSHALKLAITSQPGTLAVRYSTDLVHWQSLTTLTNATGGVAEFVAETTDPMRFYRARWTQ